MAGEYSSAFRGRGVEFAEVREYQPGDDIRTIDWNVTARLGAAYVKRYLEERELTVLFVADRSASSSFGSVRRTKGDLTVEVCAVLALAAARNNDRVGAVFATDRVEHYVAARKGRRQALRVISDLLAFRALPGGAPISPPRSPTWSPWLRRRSVIFLLSDFLGSGYEAPLARLARRHDLIAIQVIDPRERALPDVGLATLWDPESGALARSGHPRRRPARALPQPRRGLRRRAGADAGGIAARTCSGWRPASPTPSRCWRSSAGGRAGCGAERAVDGESPCPSPRWARGEPVGSARVGPAQRRARVQHRRRAGQGRAGRHGHGALPADPRTSGTSSPTPSRDRCTSCPKECGSSRWSSSGAAPTGCSPGTAVLAFYRPGKRVVPSFGVPWVQVVTGHRGVVAHEAVEIEVAAILPAGNPSLRDIREPDRTAEPGVLWGLLGALAVAGLVRLVTRRRAVRRRPEPILPETPVEAPPRRRPIPTTLALARLGDDRGRALGRARARWPATTRRWPTRCATISRRPTASPRGSAPPPSCSGRCRPGCGEGGLRRRVQDVLGDADLVKFARQRPPETAGRRLHRSRPRPARALAPRTAAERGARCGSLIPGSSCCSRFPSACWSG